MKKISLSKVWLGTLVTAVALTALAADARAHGDHGKACASDIKTLCPTAQTWQDKGACLKENESKLSTACTQARAKMKAKWEKRKAEFEAACGADVKSTCSTIPDSKEKPWEVVKCLRDNENNLSTGCQAELKKMHKHHHHHHHDKSS